MKVLLPAPILLNGQINEFAGYEICLWQELKFLQEIREPLEQLPPMLLLDLSALQKGFGNQELRLLQSHLIIDVCGILGHVLRISQIE